MYFGNICSIISLNFSSCSEIPYFDTYHWFINDVAVAFNGFQRWHWCVLIFLFSILTPIGGIAGLIFADTSIIVDTVFMAIAGGTFIYVSCSEMVVQEFDKGGYTWLKMLLVVLGGATITCLHFLPHTHSHNPEQGGHTHGPGSDHDHLWIDI